MSKFFPLKETIIVGSATLNDLYKKALSEYCIDSEVVDSGAVVIEAMSSIFKQIMARGDL